MKITVVKKAAINNNGKTCPWVIDGLPEPRK
jgi:hypothetical protein